MTSRIKIAKSDIIKHFDSLSTRVLKQTDIGKQLAEQRGFWRLAQSTTTPAFIKFLCDESKLKRLDFPFPYRSETRYTWGDVPLLEVLMSIKASSYFTHYTAMRLHGLTEQLPQTIYLNHEQPARPQNSTLEQGRINAAFSRRPRVSQNIIEYGDLRICLVNGMQTNQLGVVTMEADYGIDGPAEIRVTDLERTLIDISVRPAYSGGVFEVRKAFSFALEQVSVNRLSAMLQKMRFVYPYHQAIGYYLERAGAKESVLSLLRQLPMDFDFFLANEMGQTEYVKEWRLYVPKGF
jgi:predicted transcriptional regulator of viral defense system